MANNRRHRTRMPKRNDQLKNLKTAEREKVDWLIGWLAAILR